MREAIRAAIEALEKAEDFAGDVHHGEWAGPSDRRDKVIDKIESALSLLRAAVGEGEEPTLREREMAMMIRVLCSHTANPKTRERAMELLRKHGLQGSPLRASPIAADVQKDAERYRWLRACGPDWHNLNILDSRGNLEAEALDAAIDVAMKEGK